MLDRAGASGSRDGIDSAKECAEPEGERVLLLSVRRVVRRSGDCGVVYVAVAVSDSFYRVLRGGADCFGDVVHGRLTKAGLTMNLFMSRFLFLVSSVVALSMKAEPTTLSFQSTPEQASLLELYTSEGCSSCPPAEAWLSRLKESPGLWKTFVPMAFHVDYWDRLGWRDPFSDRQFSDRQYQYADLWHSENVYTPEFVLNGKEWRAWLVRKEVPGSSAKVGVLKVTSSETNRWQAEFQPVNPTNEHYEIHAVLMSGGVSSDVKAGENRGRRLNHDFAVGSFISVPMTQSEGTFHGHFVLAPRAGTAASDEAIGVWITRVGNLEAIQATGGWIVFPSSKQ